MDTIKIVGIDIAKSVFQVCVWSAMSNTTS